MTGLETWRRYGSGAAAVPPQERVVTCEEMFELKNPGLCPMLFRAVRPPDPVSVADCGPSPSMTGSWRSGVTAMFAKATALAM